MMKNHPHYPSPTDALLLASFFISGCSALIYQVSWQRALYGLIGVDMDSITIIVSVFMLGIGLGGMLGGWLSDRFPRQRLRWYAGIELSIALYGGVPACGCCRCSKPVWQAAFWAMALWAVQWPVLAFCCCLRC